MSATTTTPHTPWPTVKLGDVCEVVSVRGHQIKQNEIKPTGRYPVVSQSERKIEGYSDEPIAIKDVPLILFGDHTCCVKFIDFPFIVGADGTKLLRPNMMELNYFRYCLENARESLCDGKYRRHFSDLIEMEIPLPPLEVQREIVAKVEAGLKEADALAAHFKRLATLADETFKAKLDEIFSTLNAPTVKLGDVCKISAGGDAPKERMSKVKTDIFSIPIISNGVGNNAFYGYTDVAKISCPAVTIAARGTIGYAEYRDYAYFPIIRLLTAIPKDLSVLDTKYLYCYLQGKKYNVPIGAIPQLTAPELKNVTIPLPPLEVQREIVGKLAAVKARCDRLKAEAERGLKAAEALRKAVLAEAFEQ